MNPNLFTALVRRTVHHPVVRRLSTVTWQWRGVLVAVPSVTAVVLALRLTGLLQMWELAALDQCFRLRPSEAGDPRIVLVEADEADIQKLGKWPISDAQLAQLLQVIKGQQPRAIGLDLFRDLPVPPGSRELVKVLASTPNLIGVEKLVGDANSSAVAPSPYLKQHDQVGSNDFILDADGKIRRGLLYLTLGNEDPVFSLGMRLAMLYLEHEKIELSVNDHEQVQLGNRVFPPFLGNDGGYVRANDSGYQILINYRGPARTFTHVAFMDVLENRVPPDIFRDRIVIIGSTAESLKDLFYTPHSSTLLGIPERMAGVEIHANIASQILSATLENRSLLHTWSEGIEFLWIVTWAAVGACVSWRARLQAETPGKSPRAFACLVVAGTCLTVGSYLAFLQGYWVPFVPPLLAMSGSAIAITSHTARSAARIRQTLGRYVDDRVVARLLETPEGLKLGGEKQKVTVLISDVRGFSALSEELPPEQLVTLLNLYLGVMADIIHQYDGIIEAYVGDGIVAVFGLPTPRSDDALRGMACAIAMQLAMERVNQQNAELGLPQIEMGIGINTGEVVVGNIGSARRTKYSVIGRNVNLAARIESYTVGGQILISESTALEGGDTLQVTGQMQLEPKGIRGRITIYELGGLGSPYHLRLPLMDDRLIPLKDKIPLRYTVLEGKHALGNVFYGSFVSLSAKGGEVHSEQWVEPFTDLKISLLVGTEMLSGDLYAKVTQPSHSAPGFYLRFTSVPPDVAILIAEQLRRSI